MLLQKRDLVGWEPNVLTFPTKARPTPEQLEDLRVAWLVAKHAKSNTIVLSKNKRILGIGVGQMNRLESGLIAVKHAGNEAKGAAMASDAFFPFPDNVDNAAEAGIAVHRPAGRVQEGRRGDRRRRQVRHRHGLHRQTPFPALTGLAWTYDLCCFAPLTPGSFPIEPKP